MLCSFLLRRRFSQAQHVDRLRSRIITFYRDTGAVRQQSAVLDDTGL